MQNTKDNSIQTLRALSRWQTLKIHGFAVLCQCLKSTQKVSTQWLTNHKTITWTSRSSKPKVTSSSKTKSWKKSSVSSPSSPVHPQPSCNSSKATNHLSLSTKPKDKKNKKLKSPKSPILKTLTPKPSTRFWTLLKVSSFTNFACLSATDTTCQKKPVGIWFQSWWNTQRTARQILWSAQACLHRAVKERLNLRGVFWDQLRFIQFWKMWTLSSWRLRFQLMRMKIKRKTHWEPTLSRVLFCKVFTKRRSSSQTQKNPCMFWITSAIMIFSEKCAETSS